MQAEQSKNAQEPSAEGATDTNKRERSTIDFPYADLDAAIDVARSVSNIGGRSCQNEQLAGYWKVAASGGAFRARVAPGRTFGLVDTERGSIQLTDLGMRIIDPSQEKAARVEAFLNVPLYEAIYNNYKGYPLPNAAAVEREMANLGVAQKQTAKARQAFERSARQAGFFWAGNDRLTLPAVKEDPVANDSPAPSSPPQEGPPENGNGSSGYGAGNGGGGGGRTYHPFVEGLLQTMPEPGTVWAVEGRAAWLKTAATAFGLIYQGDGEIEIEAKERDKQKNE